MIGEGNTSSDTDLRNIIAINSPTLLETRLKMQHTYTVEGSGDKGNSWHVGAIMLAVVGPIDVLHWVPRYFKNAPDEASLWRAATNISNLKDWPVFAISSIEYVQNASDRDYRFNPGDLLCILPGARWPVFLRPADDGSDLTFQFLGQYVLPTHVTQIVLQLASSMF